MIKNQHEFPFFSPSRVVFSTRALFLSLPHLREPGSLSFLSLVVSSYPCTYMLFSHSYQLKRRRRRRGMVFCAAMAKMIHADDFPHHPSSHVRRLPPHLFDVCLGRAGAAAGATAVAAVATDDGFGPNPLLKDFELTGQFALCCSFNEYCLPEEMATLS